MVFWFLSDFLIFATIARKIMVEGCFRIKSEHGHHVQHCSWLIFLFADLPLFRLPETSHVESPSVFFFILRLVDWVILRFPGTPFFVHQRLKTCIFKKSILLLTHLGLHCHMRSFSSYSQQGLLSSCSAWVSPCGILSCYGAWTLEFELSVKTLSRHRLSVSMACGVLTTWTGIKIMSPTLPGGFSTTGPAGESWKLIFVHLSFLRRHDRHHQNHFQCWHERYNQIPAF